MREDTLVCVVQKGFHVPLPDGTVAEFGQRVILPAGFARKWAGRGALAILDEPEGNDAA